MAFKDFIMDLFGNVKDENGNPLGTVIGKEAVECYYKDLAVGLCINLIANSLSECTIRTYENDKEVIGEEHYILNVRPNINENSSMFFHKAVEKMIYDGEALIVNIKGNLYVADSYGVDEFPLKGNIYSSITIGNLSLNKKFRQDDVILLRLNNTNIKKLIDNLYKSYGELMKYCIGRYKLDNQEKYVLELDNVKVGDKVFQEKFKEVLNSQLEEFLNNQKTVLPLYKGQTLHDVSKDTSSNSGDFQQLMEQLFKLVSQAFNIPIDLLFSRTNNNVSQVVTQFLTFCINPIACMLEEELSAKLYNGYQGYKEGNYVRVDTSDIRHTDILEMAQAIDKLIASGSYTINDIRDLTGYNKIEEEYGDIHWMTKNYTPMVEMLKSDEEFSATSEPLQQNSLNGEQIKSLLDIVDAVVGGRMDYEGAVALISNAFPFDEAIARKILGDIESLKTELDEQVEAEKEMQEDAQTEPKNDTKVEGGAKDEE